MNLLPLTLVWLMSGIAARSAPSADEAAIRQVIEAETRAWHAGDAAAQRACWHDRPYSLGPGPNSSADGSHILATEKEMQQHYSASFGSQAPFTLTRFQIRIAGSSAWSGHDQVTTGPNGQQRCTRELRTLEYLNGAWKITSIPEPADPHVHLPPAVPHPAS
jgi:hypothetical protein